MLLACWSVVLAQAATIHDWSGRVTAEVESVVSVRDEEALAALFHNASLHGTSIKILGSRHSCQPIFVPDGAQDATSIVSNGTAVSISALNHTSVNKAKMEATVGAGLKLEVLFERLEQMDLMVDSVGGVSHQTVAGFFSTGTLPASPRHNMGFIKSIRVLKWNSTSSSVYQTVINTTDLSFTLGLGLQYIILEATMTLVPLRRFHALERIVDLKKLLASIDDYNQQYEFWRMNYLYTHNACVLWAVDSVDASHEDVPYPEECYLNALKKASETLHGLAEWTDNKTVRSVCSVGA